MQRRSSKSSNNQPGRVEKMTIAMAIVSAVLIGFIVILLVGRSLGVFGGSSGHEQGAREVSELDENGNFADGIQIPDVVGKTYAEAVSDLKEKGFQIAKAGDSANTAKKDTVVSMSPKAGERAKSGDTITIYVSDGSGEVAASTGDGGSQNTDVEQAISDGQVIVPNIVGQTSEDAVIILVEAGLQAGSIVETTNEDPNLTGLICAQSIAPDTAVSKDTKINMELSTGPAKVTYSYNADITAPTEGENYTYGIPVKVMLITSDGTTLLSTTTTDFPLQGTYKGITAPTGTVTFVYTASTPSTTDEETGEVIGGDTREYTVTRAVTFTQEN